jgi:hypothetical protein
LDLLDISHHNTITDWDLVPDVPIVHKVNEGNAVDRQVLNRMPIIESRTTIFGGYTVLIVSGSSIRQQVERYADIMEPFWRPGAFTQLDIEPWERYERPVSTEEIIEAGEVHDELFGPGRFTAYINPNQLPKQYDQLHRSGWLRNRLWLPNYSKDGPKQAVTRRAVVHQYTSRATVPGFTAGIDANKVYNWDALRSIAGISTPTTPPPSEDDMPVKTSWKPKGSENVYDLDTGQQISPAIRTAWKSNPALTVIEVYDDPHTATRECVEYRAGQRPVDPTSIVLDLPDATLVWGE